MKKNEARRIVFARKERLRALALATARAEAHVAYNDAVGEMLKARGVDIETTEWNYEPLTGIAVRIR